MADLDLLANNSNIFNNSIEGIHSVSITENEGCSKIRTYTLTTVFTSLDGYRFELCAPQVQFERYDMEIEFDDDYYIPYRNPITKIELMLKILTQNHMAYSIKDVTPYHEMTLKEIEAELGYKIKLKNT